MIRKIKSLWNIMRIDSNSKNVIMVIFAFYMSHANFNLQGIVWGILSLSLISSAAYTYNSYTDYFLDKNNKNKKHYHEAIKNIGRNNTFILFIILLSLGLYVGYTINKNFFIVVSIYALVNFLYTNPVTRLKEKKYLDIIFGAGLTHVLRFTAGWYIFMTTIPPILILMILSFSKMGGFMMYKNLDREYLKKAGIKNTTTSFSAKQLDYSSKSFLGISLILFIIICLNGTYFNYPILGKLPIELLFSLLFIPFIAYWGIKLQKNNKYEFKKIRSYAIMISLTIFLLVGIYLYLKLYV